MMITPNMLLAPWRASIAMSGATLESALAMQKSMAAMSMFQTGKFGEDDEERLRSAFHAAADANLRRWEDTANFLKDLPDVYHDAMKMPGELLTDWFDGLRRS